MWPTPRTGCHGEPGEDLRHPTIAGLWATPRTSDTNGAGKHGDGGMDLRTQVDLWATPTPRDWKNEDGTAEREGSPALGRQVLQTETDGSVTSPRAVLSPFFCEALMGFPPSWTVPTVCARSETPWSPHKPLERSSSSHGGR